MNISPSDVLPVIPPTTFPLSGLLTRTCRGTRSAYPTVASLKAFNPSPMIVSASGSGALDTRKNGVHLATPMLLERGQFPYHRLVALTGTTIGVEPCDDLVEPTAQASRRDCDP
jgi:hypothetical protein